MQCGSALRFTPLGGFSIEGGGGQKPSAREVVVHPLSLSLLFQIFKKYCSGPYFIGVLAFTYGTWSVFGIPISGFLRLFSGYSGSFFHFCNMYSGVSTGFAGAFHSHIEHFGGLRL
jgi:hypothetical protein